MVYRAQDRALDRVVALKFLPPSMSSDEAAKNRFIHEAKAASGLNHPNIATVYEIGETEDHQLFIAMGYYPGESLKEKIAKDPIPPEAVLDIAIQLASGMKKAHEHGVIHRDIKPGNIMITAEGTVILLDFGLAKLSYESGYTQVGQMAGTIAYMSPEQARSEAVDQRTDIWSFGVVLYELLTGRPPFRGDNAQSVIRAILEDDPEPPVASDGEISRVAQGGSRPVPGQGSGSPLPECGRSVGGPAARTGRSGPEEARGRTPGIVVRDAGVVVSGWSEIVSLCRINL